MNYVRVGNIFVCFNLKLFCHITVNRLQHGLSFVIREEEMRGGSQTNYRFVSVFICIIKQKKSIVEKKSSISG